MHPLILAPMCCRKKKKTIANVCWVRSSPAYLCGCCSKINVYLWWSSLPRILVSSAFCTPKQDLLQFFSYLGRSISRINSFSCCWALIFFLKENLNFNFTVVKVFFFLTFKNYNSSKCYAIRVIPMDSNGEKQLCGSMLLKMMIKARRKKENCIICEKNRNYEKKWDGNKSVKKSKITATSERPQ